MIKGEAKVKALDTVLNLDYGEKLTRTQIEELKIAVNQITNKASRASDNNYRLRYENWKLRDQLAKANVRVKELELVVAAITHAEDEVYVDGWGLVERWSDVGEEVKSLLNKFAIEKKIEALNKLSAPLNYNIEHPEFCMKKRIELEIEQLRKEQPQCK